MSEIPHPHVHSLSLSICVRVMSVCACPHVCPRGIAAVAVCGSTMYVHACVGWCAYVYVSSIFYGLIVGGLSAEGSHSVGVRVRRQPECRVGVKQWDSARVAC
jgi:hypothetical protein